MKQLILKVIWWVFQAKRYFSYFYDKIVKTRNIENIKNLISEDKLLSGLDPIEKNDWEKRIKTTLSSDDNQDILRHPEAGTIQGNYLVMHNGLKVDPLSYYGLPPLKLLVDNKGVHEPQEEKVFQEVLKTIRSSAVMLELGSYWSFYSMWFYSKVENAKCYMIEAELPNIKIGEKNFRINKMKGFFYQAFLGDRTFITHKGDRYITVDDFVRNNNISFIDMLHSDIQGYEYKMLQGARETFNSKKVGYVFISTHSNKIHSDCIQFLKEFNFTIIAEANIDESFSADGLIAAKAPDFEGIEIVPISKRKKVQIE